MVSAFKWLQNFICSLKVIAFSTFDTWILFNQKLNLSVRKVLILIFKKTNCFFAMRLVLKKFILKVI